MDRFLLNSNKRCESENKEGTSSTSGKSVKKHKNRTLAKNYWLFKMYLLEFDIGRLGNIWIQQGCRELKKFGHLWCNL
jgi:hypothetical protein